MPLEIAFPNNGEGIEVRAFGHINSNEILKAYSEIQSEESIKKRKYFLIDRSGCEEEKGVRFLDLQNGGA